MLTTEHGTSSLLLDIIIICELLQEKKFAAHLHDKALQSWVEKEEIREAEEEEISNNNASSILMCKSITQGSR